MKRRTIPNPVALLCGVALLALGVLGIINAASASYPAGVPSQAPLQAGKDQAKLQNNDGFDQLAANEKALSYSALVNLGKVNNPSRRAGASVAKLLAHRFNIAWGNDMLPGSGTGEPGVAMNPNLPSTRASVVTPAIDHTTNGATTWADIAQPAKPRR